MGVIGSALIVHLWRSKNNVPTQFEHAPKKEENHLMPAPFQNLGSYRTSLHLYLSTPSHKEAREYTSSHFFFYLAISPLNANVGFDSLKFSKKGRIKRRKEKEGRGKKIRCAIKLRGGEIFFTVVVDRFPESLLLRHDKRNRCSEVLNFGMQNDDEVRKFKKKFWDYGGRGKSNFASFARYCAWLRMETQFCGRHDIDTQWDRTIE